MALFWNLVLEIVLNRHSRRVGQDRTLLAYLSLENYFPCEISFAENMKLAVESAKPILITRFKTNPA